jgi:ABC-type branched-subunit amino acid transport system ATPase component
MQGLSINNVCAGYAGRDIIHNVSIDLPAGSIACVVGPNGSGKSTLMKTVAGLLPARTGSIAIGTRDVTALGAPGRARAQLAYVPQEHNVFRNMSIGDNLRMGVEFLGASESEMRQRADFVHELFPELAGRLREKAGNLSGGQRQMLAFGCALMAQPSVLLLDEPSAGLSPKYVDEMFEAIGRVHRAGLTVFMIEQNTRKGLENAQIGILLVSGQIRATMPAKELLQDEQFHRLYLGGH